MKTKIISKILLTLGLVLVLGSVVTPMHGGTQPSSASVIGPPDQQFPVVTINSIDNVTRGSIGTFVLSVNPKILLATIFLNFVDHRRVASRPRDPVSRAKAQSYGARFAISGEAHSRSPVRFRK